MPKNQIGASTSHDMPKCYEITCYSTRISILRVHLQTHSSKVGEACRTWPYFEGRAPKVQRREGGTERNKMGYYHHDLWLFKHVSTCFKMLPNTPTTKHQHFFGDLNLTTKNWQLRNTCGFSQEELVFYAENLVISPTKTEDVSNMQRACLKMVETFGFQESVALGHPAAVGKFCLQAAALARDLNGTLVAWKWPSGKRLRNYGKSPCFMGKSTNYKWQCSIAM